MKVLNFLRTSVLVLGIAAIGLYGCEKEPESDKGDNQENTEGGNQDGTQDGSQDGNQGEKPEGPAFVFKINEVTAASVKFDVDAAVDTMRYTVMVVEKSYADQFTDDEALFQDDMDYFADLWNEAPDYYEYLDDVIEEYTTVGDGIGLVIDELTPETEYLFYAYGLELDGTRTTDIYREYVTTEAIEKSDATFEIDAVIEGASVDVTITPSDDEVYYYFDMIEQESVDIDFEGDMLTAATYYINYNVMMGINYGWTVEEVMLELASQGPDQYYFDCAPDTEYVIFAMAVSLDGNVISEITTETIVTGDIVPSDNVITLSVDAVTTTAVTVSTTTTNDDTYFLGIEPVYKFEGMTDEEIIETVLYEYGDFIDWSTESGNVEALELSDLEPDMEYLLMAFGIRGYYATTPLVKQTVSTEMGNDPALCTFEVSYVEITDKSAHITVTPSFDDIRYYWDVVEPSTTDEDYVAIIQEEMDLFIEYEEFSSAFEFWQYMSFRGPDEYTYYELTPGTEYDVIIGLVDLEAGGMVTPFIRQSFTTLGEGETPVSAPASLRKREAPSNKAVSRRAGKPVQEGVAPMRKADLKNRRPAAEKAVNPARHSAFLQK